MKKTIFWALVALNVVLLAALLAPYVQRQPGAWPSVPPAAAGRT